jgi:hypothetical protein
VSVFASETVVKNSSQFNFPLTVGISASNPLLTRDVSFNSIIGSKTIELSWSLPFKAYKANISIFNLAGVRIKTYPLSSPEGSVQWNLSGKNKPASGIYFARLSSGTYNKSLKIVIY